MKAHYLKTNEDGDGFSKMFPTKTARDGRVRPNSKRDGRGQGRGSSKKFVHCRVCGHVFDRNITDHSGGVYSGDGGLTPVVVTTATVTTLAGASANDDSFGVQSVSSGAGCPECGTKAGVGRQDR